MDSLRVVAGALTGFVVGLTGVGGGALMTPILLLFFGTAPLTAVGTDLWFAALTKISISVLHFRARLIDWPIVLWLWLGSLPASLLTVAWMASRPADAATIAVVRGGIGIAVCFTAVTLMFQSRIRAFSAAAAREHDPRWQRGATVLTGVVLGVIVTLTSVGAGALGAVALFYLYQQRLTPPRLVATDIAHAIPLALCAGMGHLAVDHVDSDLLVNLLIGSIPAGIVGATISSRVPHVWLRTALGTVLLVVGLLMAGDAIR